MKKSKKLVLILCLLVSTSSMAQVINNTNGLYSQGIGNNGQDNGNKNGWDNPNNPNHTGTPGVPIDQEVWILLVGGLGIFFWQYRKQQSIIKETLEKQKTD